MITGITAILGLLSSVAPRVIGYFEQKQVDLHEIELTKLKLDASERNAEISRDIEVIKADSVEAKSIHDADAATDGGRFINTLKASIRPIVTYAFFIMFVGIKTTAAYLLVTGGSSGAEVLNALWDIETMSLFGAIMSFWFGARIIDKMDYNKISRRQMVVTKAKDV